MPVEAQRGLDEQFADSLKRGRVGHSTFLWSEKRQALDIYQADVEVDGETYVFKVHKVNREIAVADVVGAITNKLSRIERCVSTERRFDATVWHDDVCYTLWHQKKTS